jgi:phosphoribosylformylglycinamidine cyclo-ligase
VPNVFKVLEDGGNVADREMYRVFNMGIGMILAVQEDDVARVLAVLKEGQSDCRLIGRVETGEGVRLE